MNIIEMVREAYITVMGEKKWNSLTDQEKHDVVMAIVSDASKALDRI